MRTTSLSGLANGKKHWYSGMEKVAAAAAASVSVSVFEIMPMSMLLKNQVEVCPKLSFYNY